MIKPLIHVTFLFFLCLHCFHQGFGIGFLVFIILQSSLSLKLVFLVIAMETLRKDVHLQQLQEQIAMFSFIF